MSLASLLGRDRWETLLTPGLLARWGAPAEGARLLVRGDHFVFRVISPAGPLILRLTPAAYEPFHQVCAEASWVAYLWERGARVARPVPSASGALVEHVVLPGEGPMSVLAFEEAPGRPVDVADATAWNPSLFERWGRLAGQMHALAAEFTPPEGCRRPQLQVEGVIALARRLLPASPGLAERMEAAWAGFRHLPTGPAHWGLVHGDIHHGNLRVDAGGEVTTFDFDRCCYAWFALDVALVLDMVGRCVSPAFIPAFLDPFLQGYRREHPFPPESVDALPHLLDFANVLHDDELRRAFRQA